MNYELSPNQIKEIENEFNSLISYSAEVVADFNKSNGYGFLASDTIKRTQCKIDEAQKICRIIGYNVTERNGKIFLEKL